MTSPPAIFRFFPFAGNKVHIEHPARHCENEHDQQELLRSASGSRHADCVQESGRYPTKLSFLVSPTVFLQTTSWSGSSSRTSATTSTRTANATTSSPSSRRLITITASNLWWYPPWRRSSTSPRVTCVATTGICAKTTWGYRRPWAICTGK